MNVTRRARCKLAGPLVDCDGFELIFLFDINGLYDMIGAVEYYEGIARNVGLFDYPSVTIVFGVLVRSCRTMI